MPQQTDPAGTPIAERKFGWKVPSVGLAVVVSVYVLANGKCGAEVGVEEAPAPAVPPSTPPAGPPASDGGASLNPHDSKAPLGRNRKSPPLGSDPGACEHSDDDCAETLQSLPDGPGRRIDLFYDLSGSSAGGLEGRAPAAGPYCYPGLHQAARAIATGLRT